jgi:hypothetical protein
MNWLNSVPVLHQLHYGFVIAGLLAITVLALVDFVEPRFEHNAKRVGWIKSAARWSLLLLALFEVVAFIFMLRIDSLRDRRRLSEEQRTLITDELAKHPGHVVRIHSLLEEPESGYFADEFANLFKHAGWTVQREVRAQAEGVGVTIIGGVPLESGTGCRVPSGSALHLVVYAFQRAALEADLHTGTLQCENAMGIDAPLIFVGRNPNSESGQWSQEAKPATGPVIKARLPAPD